MLKPITIFIISLLFVGSGIGELIAIYVYPVTGEPDKYEVYRGLFAGICGFLFIGGFLYAVSVAIAVFRFIRAIRKSQA